MTFSFPPHNRSSSFAGWEPSSLTNPKILFLAPFAPSLNAAHGGGRVTAQLIAHLAARHPVAVCYLRAPEERSIDEDLLDQCEIVKEVVLPDIEKTGVKSWLYRFKVWAQVLAGKPLWAIDRSVATYQEQVSQLVHAWKPDIIQVEFHIMGQYLSTIEGYPAPRILVQHEPGEKAALEALRNHLAQGIFMPYLDLLAWKRFEKAVIRNVQNVVVFTERDRRTVSDLNVNTPVTRIPLGAELPQKPSKPLGEPPMNLLFVGNFLHIPNVDAAMRLVDHIFPAVRSVFPEMRLYIVGSRPPHQLTQMADDHVFITGRVEDVIPYLDQATLVVVPIRLGGGMRVKVLEALAAGKAVVASPLAIEGLDLANGEQVMVAETDQEFCEAIINLIKMPQQCVSLAAHAREWSCENLGWEKSVRAYEALYENLLSV